MLLGDHVCEKSDAVKWIDCRAVRLLSLVALPATSILFFFVLIILIVTCVHKERKIDY